MPPYQYATEWIASWNARDVDAVLAHYADDVVLRSPTAAAVVPESGGVIVGRDALRTYWTTALAQLPDLHFELDGVFASVTGLTILHRNERGRQITETLRFNPSGQVDEVLVGHRADPPDA